MATTSPFALFPRVIRPIPDPFGLYLRAARNDHHVLLDLIAAGDAAFFGVVLDPTLIGGRHRELHEQVIRHQLDAVLDPKTQQSAMPGGYTEDLGELPWGVKRMHTETDFQGTSGARLIAAVGNFAIDRGFTQVIAPTHLLRTVDDRWLALDIESTVRLRNHLDKNGGQRIQLIYSLALPYAAFRNPEQRHSLIEQLKTVPASSVWLRIDGLGAGSRSPGVVNYIEGASYFHGLGLPVIADQMGGLVGLALLAFGAVGGLAHGITFGESFNAGPWRRRRTGGGFGPHHRVYFPSLDLTLAGPEAKLLFDATPRAAGKLGCRDTDCCPHGVKDMLQNPARHFLFQRVQQVLRLSRIPEQLRPQEFLERQLRPATDSMMVVSDYKWTDKSYQEKFRAHLKRLTAIRQALGNQATERPPSSFSLVPRSRAAREARA